MDVTPQELRSSEIKDSWRGYDRDEVDDLLERAAVTIESLTQQVHEVHSRPAPTAATAEVPLPSSRDDAEMLQRTLLLAQRAADEAVNEAQLRAKQVLEESEAKAQALVSDAEATARRIAEGERRRLEAELVDLAARRELLQADADALETYVVGYRDRLRAAIEGDLARLAGGDVEASSERPEVHEVEIPVAREPVAAVVVTEPVPEPADTSGPATDEHTWEPGPAARVVEGLDAAPNPSSRGPFAAEASSVSSSPSSPSPVAAPPRPESARPEPAPEWPPAPAAEAPSAPAAESSWLAASEADADWGPSTAAWDAPPPWEQEGATPPAELFAPGDPIEANSIDTDSLDDDAFFASLREAVRDDAPLGPRDEQQSAPYDVDADQEQRRFRRRR